MKHDALLGRIVGASALAAVLLASTSVAGVYEANTPKRPLVPRLHFGVAAPRSRAARPEKCRRRPLVPYWPDASLLTSASSGAAAGLLTRPRIRMSVGVRSCLA
jgi:hypothetical protein